MRAFELSELAAIVGIPISKAKNWTIGRPLTITPSIHIAAGTGSRNLYSLEDMCRMSIAKELNHLGLPTKAIDAVLRLFEAYYLKLLDWQALHHLEWLLIWRIQKQWSIEFREGKRVQFTRNLENGLMLIVIDFKKIVRHIYNSLREMGKG
jgi:hypothetical protein